MPDRITGKGAALIGDVGNKAGLLAGNAQVEDLAQAEMARRGGDPIGADAKSGLIEEDVAGLPDGVVHVQHPVRLVAVPDTAAPGPCAVAGIGAVRIDAMFQGGQGDHGLEGRSRRIGGGQGLVE
jgi:hypothetical protein